MELAQNQSVQAITLAQIQDRMQATAIQLMAMPREEQMGIATQGFHHIVTFHDAIEHLFDRFNQVSNHEQDLVYPGTLRSILYQIHQDPTSPLDDYHINAR